MQISCNEWSWDDSIATTGRRRRRRRRRRKWRLGSCVQEFDHKLLAFGRLAGCELAAAAGVGGGGGVDTQERSESKSVDERSLAFFLERVCVVDVTGTLKTRNSWSIQRVSTRKFCAYLRCSLQPKTCSKASKAQGIYRTHPRTHARTLAEQQHSWLFVCLLVGCSRKANSFTLPVSFSAAQLIITHFRSNSSFPTSIAATSSAATTTMTTTYDQEVVVFLAVKKDHHSSKINSCRHLLQNPKPYADTHREKGKTATKEKETRDPAGSQEWVPSRKPSQRTTLHKTTTAKLSQQESIKQSKASKRIIRVSFFSFFSKVIPESLVKSNTRKSSQRAPDLNRVRERRRERASERAAGGRAGGRAGRTTDRVRSVSQKTKRVRILRRKRR